MTAFHQFDPCSDAHKALLIAHSPDRQHRSRGGFGFSFIANQPKGVTGRIS